MGTMVSRGKLITAAPLWVGEMCRIIEVSERDPGMPRPYPWVWRRESDPMIRMFSEPFSFGGRLPSSPLVTTTWWMLSHTPR